MIRVYLSRVLGERRISQAELARATGIRPSTICDIYNEMSERISLEHLDRICEYLNCSLEEIMVYEENVMKKTGEQLITEEHGKRSR